MNTVSSIPPTNINSESQTKKSNSRQNDIQVDNRKQEKSTEKKDEDEIQDLEKYIDQMSAKDETNAVRLYDRMTLELKAEVSFLRKLNQATLFQDVSLKQSSNSILRDEIMFLRQELQTKNNFIKLFASSSNKLSGSEVQKYLSKKTSSNHCNRNREERNDSLNNCVDGISVKINEDTGIESKNLSQDQPRKKVVEIIGDFMLNNIQVRELSKISDVRISYFSGCKTPDLLNHIKRSIYRKPDKIIIHVGTNDLMSEDNILYSIKKIMELVREGSTTTELAFSSIIIRKDKDESRNQIKHINLQLHKFCTQHKVGFIDNSNITESCLDISNVHLNRKGNSLLAENLLNHILER